MSTTDIEICEIESLQTSCDGGDGALGHPTVYLTITPSKADHVDCSYCGKRYKLKAGAKVSGHHYTVKRLYKEQE